MNFRAKSMTWYMPGSEATPAGSPPKWRPNSARIPLSIKRCWRPKIEALLNDDKNYLVIVGTGHLVGRDSVIDLLKREGVGATQR